MINNREFMLPDPLLNKNGEKISTAEGWKQSQRPEIIELFRKHSYGRAPLQRPTNLKFEMVETDQTCMDGTAIRKRVDLSFSGPGGAGTIRLHVYIPVKAKGPMPAFLFICNRGMNHTDLDQTAHTPFWPVKEIISRGYVTAAFHVEDLDPDHHDEFKNGVHGIFDSQQSPRPSDAWGTLSAWAWGASRAMDYLETDSDIDAERVAIIGHSRGGKTALWCGAQDERFAMVISNNSGCGGAAISRGKQGETIKNINDTFPHWFCENFKQFNNNEEQLPIDQHMLLSLIAPRLLYVSSATEDTWADPNSEFLACIHAGPVYHLLGVKGLESSSMPDPDQPLHKGRIGYHLRTGEHDLTVVDWHYFMDYADQHMV